jgi:predicted component of type VI protein secretion system
MNKFYPQDLVNQLVQLYNLLVNLNKLVPLYRELDDKSTLEQLEYNEEMIIEY